MEVNLKMSQLQVNRKFFLLFWILLAFFASFIKVMSIEFELVNILWFAWLALYLLLVIARCNHMGVKKSTKIWYSVLSFIPIAGFVVLCILLFKKGNNSETENVQ